MSTTSSPSMALQVTSLMSFGKDDGIDVARYTRSVPSWQVASLIVLMDSATKLSSTDQCQRQKPRSIKSRDCKVGLKQ